VLLCSSSNFLTTRRSSHAQNNSGNSDRTASTPHLYHSEHEGNVLSSDLADLYDVEVKVLNQAVKRNKERFPADFVFQLTHDEFNNLKSQIVTSSWGGARRALPYAFTEHGILMLSSVLRSPRAVQVNIEIMRAFISLRELIASNATLAQKLTELERNTMLSLRWYLRRCVRS
jgi:ORF6N domain-containing protein